MRGMTDKLIKYVLEETPEDSKICRAFQHWTTTCKRFRAFIDEYKNKIRKKVRGAETEDDIEDIRFELEIPYLLLLNNDFNVQYEAYGTSQQAPDFKITYKETLPLNFEVARIRESEFCDRLEQIERKIAKRVYQIPSHLGANFIYINPSSSLIEKMEHLEDEIVDFIGKTIKRVEAILEYDKPTRYRIYPIEGANDLKLELIKPSMKRNFNNTSWNGGGVFPLPYTGKEQNKFGDIIIDKLRQAIPDMINMLVINTNTWAHDEDSLIDALISIRGFVGEQNDEFFKQKGYNSTEDFINKSRKLRGILFRSTWIKGEGARNYVWENPDANNKLPASVSEYLRNMDRAPIT